MLKLVVVVVVAVRRRRRNVMEFVSYIGLIMIIKYSSLVVGGTETDW